jgi:hypothetical protein
MKEEWRAVPGYEGLYELSNMGWVRSLDRIVRASGVSKRRAFGHVLNPYTNKLRYQYVALSKDGKSKTLSLHRLVANVFVPNPNNYSIINHKDENPSNNRADNLEWCTQMYNVHYGTGMERGDAKSNHGRMAVDKLDLNGNYICSYRSISEAAEAVGVRKQSICACLKGKHSNGRNVFTAGGYKWRYKE